MTEEKIAEIIQKKVTFLLWGKDYTEEEFEEIQEGLAMPVGAFAKTLARQILDSLAGGELGEDEIKAVWPEAKDLDFPFMGQAEIEQELLKGAKAVAHAQTIRCNAQCQKRIEQVFEEIICPMCYRLNPQHATMDNGKGCNWCQEKEDWTGITLEEHLAKIKEE